MEIKFRNANRSNPGEMAFIAETDFFEVAECDGKICGFHIVKKINYPPLQWAGVILSLWVSDEVREQGIGTKLKQRGEAWAKSQNFLFLQTAVHPTNQKMLSINEKNGFSIAQYNMRKRL
jgi:GNAT superfamily N-acetyltransferase